MTDHDPLCPAPDVDDPDWRDGCFCKIIAKARADERERVAQAIEERRAEWMTYYANSSGVTVGPGTVLRAYVAAARIARGGA